MQYVDDAIVLINKLGGTVAIEQRGRFFRKEIQKVVLNGRLYEFNSLHEMTQWVIANVVSTVKNESGARPVSRSILRS